MTQTLIDGEGGVSAILHDEDGFWKPLTDALKVAAIWQQLDIQIHTVQRPYAY